MADTERKQRKKKQTKRRIFDPGYLLKQFYASDQSPFEASAMDTVDRVIDQRRDFFDHLKRVIDWVNTALEEKGYTTRFSMMHAPNVDDGRSNMANMLKHINKEELGLTESEKRRRAKRFKRAQREEVIQRLNPQNILIYLHADPDLIDFMNIEVVDGVNKSGQNLGKKDYEVFEDSSCLCPESNIPKSYTDEDGIPLLMAPIARINMSAAERPYYVLVKDPCEFFYQNPSISKGNTDEGFAVIKTVREILISHMFSYIPVYRKYEGNENDAPWKRVSEQWDVEIIADTLIEKLKQQRASQEAADTKLEEERAERLKAEATKVDEERLEEVNKFVDTTAGNGIHIIYNYD